jgi:hypothetical protein
MPEENDGLRLPLGLHHDVNRFVRSDALSRRWWNTWLAQQYMSMLEADQKLDTAALSLAEPNIADTTRINTKPSDCHNKWMPLRVRGYLCLEPNYLLLHTPSNLDLFLCGSDSRVYTSSWPGKGGQTTNGRRSEVSFPLVRRYLQLHAHPPILTCSSVAVVKKASCSE